MPEPEELEELEEPKLFELTDEQAKLLAAAKAAFGLEHLGGKKKKRKTKRKQKKRKTRKVKKRKAGMIRHLLSRELTGKTTPSMIEDFLALKQKQERNLKQKQDRNNIALKQIEYYKKITDDANTNNLNDINRALIYLSNSLKEDLLLNKDKEDMEDFIKKLNKKVVN